MPKATPHSPSQPQIEFTQKTVSVKVMPSSPSRSPSRVNKSPSKKKSPKKLLVKRGEGGGSKEPNGFDSTDNDDDDDGADEDEAEGCGLSQKEKEAILTNFRLEAASRRKALEDECLRMAVSHRSWCETQRVKLPPFLREVTVAVMQEHGFNISSLREYVLRSGGGGGNGKGKMAEQLMPMSGAEQTARRKRHLDVDSEGQTGRTPRHRNPAEEKAQVTAKPSRKIVNGTPSNRRPGSLARKTPATARRHDMDDDVGPGFVFRARPSTSNTNGLNPLLPPTPNVARSSAAPGTARKARRHESIVAYSMNGSPLGVYDINMEGDKTLSPQSPHVAAPLVPPKSTAPTYQGSGPSSKAAAANRPTSIVPSSEFTFEMIEGGGASSENNNFDMKGLRAAIAGGANSLRSHSPKKDKEKGDKITANDLEAELNASDMNPETKKRLKAKLASMGFLKKLG